MMSDAVLNQPGVRKTATFTHRQLAGGVTITAALLALQPLKEMFLTNDKADTMRVQIQALRDNQHEIKASISQAHGELLAQINRGNDLILQSIKESESRTVHNQDKIEKRLDHTENKMDRLDALLNNVKRR